MTKDVQVMLIDFSQMLSIYLYRTDWSLTSGEKEKFHESQEMTVQKHIKICKLILGRNYSFTTADLIQKENLSRWSLVKLLICRVGTQCLASPWLYCSCEHPRRGSWLWQRCRLCNFNQNNKNRRKPKLSSGRVWFLSCWTHQLSKRLPAYFGQILWRTGKITN